MKSTTTPFYLTSPQLAKMVGKYNLQLTYSNVDDTFEDGDRKVAVDTDAFYIVAKTADADVIEDIVMTSDICIGLKGDKGDKGDKGKELKEIKAMVLITQQ